MLWKPLEGGDVEGLRHENQGYLTGHAYQVVDMLVVDEENMLVTADESGEIRLWSLPTATVSQVRGNEGRSESTYHVRREGKHIHGLIEELMSLTSNYLP